MLICTILLSMRNLSREYLETLSSIELIRLADEYGIDIPDDLSRQFIIGDLIQLGEELERAENAHDYVDICLVVALRERVDIHSLVIVRKHYGIMRVFGTF